MGWVLTKTAKFRQCDLSSIRECEEIRLTDKLESRQFPCAPLCDNDAGRTDVSVEELTVAMKKQQGLRDLQSDQRRIR